MHVYVCVCVCVCVCVYVCVIYLTPHNNILCSEVRELESRLDELRSKTEIKPLEDGNKENTEAIQSKLNSLPAAEPLS